MKGISIDLIVLLSLLGLLTIAQTKQFVHTDLTAKWKLKILGGDGETNALLSKEIETSVPTVLHLDLLHEKLIPDPFLDRNYLTVKWVAESTI